MASKIKLKNRKSQTIEEVFALFVISRTADGVSETTLKTILKEFYQLRGLTPEGKKDEFGCSVTYGKLKQWFFEQYPQFKKMEDSVNEIMKKVKEKAEARKAA